MQLETSRFGTIEIEDDSIITMTQPIIGFQEYRRFVLLPGPDGGIMWLQSTEDKELAFILMNPKQVVPDYSMDLPERELTELAVTDADELEVYTIVVVPDDETKIRANLKAPVLINTKQRLGKQTILEKSNYPIQFFLVRAQGREENAQEVANARTDT